MNTSKQLKIAQESRNKNIFRLSIVILFFIAFLILLIIVYGHKDPFEEMYNDCYTGVVNDPEFNQDCSVHIETSGIHTKDDLNQIVERWNLVGSIIVFISLIDIIAGAYVFSLCANDWETISVLTSKEKREIETVKAKSYEKVKDYDEALKIYRKLGNKSSDIERIRDVILNEKIAIAKNFEKDQKYDDAIQTWKHISLSPYGGVDKLIWNRLGIDAHINRIKLSKAKVYEDSLEYNSALEIYNELKNTSAVNKVLKKIEIQKAKEREEALDYENAINIWEKLGNIKEAARVRKLVLDSKTSKTIIHGDYVDDRDTIVKDSVVNRSNIGADTFPKMQNLKELKELHDSGAISDDEFEEMKKEIINK